MRTALWAALFRATFSLAHPCLTPKLSDANLSEIRAILTSPSSKEAELRYQQLVEAQTISDLAILYSPENSKRLEVTYASFTPEGLLNPNDPMLSPRGEDGGFGLHVIKRLTLRLECGRSKIIEVNELWSEDRRTRGLFLPDEIRLKTLAFEGEPGAPGAEQRFLFDSFRVGWDQFGELDPRMIRIFRVSRYLAPGAMRVPISAPFSCLRCHSSVGSPKAVARNTRLAANFLSAGERRNFGSIIQESHFNRRLTPIEQTEGYQDYLSYLEEAGVAADFSKAVREELADPVESTSVRGFPEAFDMILKEKRKLGWLGPDQALLDSDSWPYRRFEQGIYVDRSPRDNLLVFWVDALESKNNGGKYKYWEPFLAIPKSVAPY